MLNSTLFGNDITITNRVILVPLTFCVTKIGSTTSGIITFMCIFLSKYRSKCDDPLVIN